MRPLAFLASGGLLCAGAVLAAQARSQNLPQFRAGVDVVELDVSVFDKDHHPIKDLKASDFTLLEDKLSRSLVAFGEINIPEPPPVTATWMRDVTGDVVENDVADKRLFVILIDDQSFGKDLMFKKIRDEVSYAARAVINRLGPSDLAAVVFSGDNRRSQEFTADHAKLLAAVDNPFGAITPTASLHLSHPPVAEPTSGTVLRRASEYLMGVPARRKVIVDITDYDNPCLWGPDLATATLIFEAAQRAGITIHTLHPRAGVLVCGYPAIGEIEKFPDLANWVVRTPRETGGDAFLGIEEPAVADAAVSRIFEASGSYYMLGYTSADIEKFHFISVLVDRPDAQVKTREKYYRPEHEKPPSGPLPAATVASMADILPKGDVPLRVAVAPFASVSGASPTAASVAVIVSVRQVRPEGATGSIRESLDLRAAMFTREGGARGSQARTVAVRLPAGTGDVDYEILDRIDIAKPGLYELRLSTHSTARSADGSVYVTVDIPDFANAPLSLSGVVLGTDNGLAVDGADRLRALLPLTPTTARAFDRGEPATAFLRAYEGGGGAIRPVALHTRIVNDHDQAVMDRNETLGPDRFDRTRSAGIFVRLPTGDLAPGPYLLSLEASVGKADSRRELRFVIR
jgi:VWFA-related protein